MTKADERTGELEASPDPGDPGEATGEGAGEVLEDLGEASRDLLRSRTLQVTAGVVVLGIVGFTLLGISLGNVLVIGLQRGAVFSLVALGIALVYKATRVLNFAQGILGSVPAFFAYVIMVGFDYGDIRAPLDEGSLWWAALLAIALGIVLALLVNVLVIQRLAEASPVTALVATVGVALFFVAAQVIMFEAQLRPFPRFVSGNWFTVGTTPVSWHTVVVVIVLMAAAAALAVFFRTPPGTALLATAQEPFAAELSGVSVRGMSALAWSLAGALGAIGGILGAGVFENIRPGFMLSEFLIPAFVAAVLGGLTSMVGAVIGGLLLGVAVAFANDLVLSVGFFSELPGAPQVATLLILVAVLLFRPRGLLGREA